MKSVYRVLAYLIALDVVVQSAAVVFATFGLFKWVDDGGTLDKAAFEDESVTFGGMVGYDIHFMNGMFLIPLLALLLLVVSFFTKLPGAARWAGIVFLVVLVQVFLGLFAHGTPWLGMLHGANALVLFALAGMAGDRVRRAAKSAKPDRQLV